jgi:co-chaperonin GroES (HSP10)
MEIRTLGNKVAVERIAAEKATTSGIVLQRTDEPDRARVVSVGPEVESVKVGEVLLVNWNEAQKAGDLYVLPETAAIWVFEDE